MARSKRSLFFVLFASWLVEFSGAQDPLRGSRRGAPFKRTATLASSSQPWRRSSSGYSRYQPDLSSHFIDFEDCKRDRRSRLWSVNFKTRNVGKTSWTTRIVFANLATFVLQFLRPSVTDWGIKLSDRILQGQELYRLVTPMFLHGGLIHLYTNMYSLQRIGNDVETLFGPGRYVATYVAAGVAGNIFSAIKSPNPSLGASGAVFGIVGAYFVFLTRNDWLLGSYGQAMTNAITQTIAANMLLGALNPVIDNWAHLGGALGGAAMAYLFGPRLYLAQLPDGGRVIVDRPMVRMPRSLESLPGRVGDQFQRMARRMQVARYKMDLPSKPWRRNNTPRRPLNAPNRSIKPRDV